ncbi:hypothetical protein V8G54_007534, partial [Vigna mungo]
NQITKNSEMVLLLHLPRFPLYLITSSHSLRLRALSTSSKTTLLRPPKATLTTSQPVTVTNPSATELSLEKLFVPPGTNVSLDSARVLNGSNILLSNYANDALISQAEFVKSSVKTEDCPSDGLPEFALVGRSNVGKSSLLNSLVRRKKLALTSKKPGKTQCINHFRINDSWYLVDLPGYGYASAPHELRMDWAKFTKDYFLNRSTLVSVFLLIDASIPAKQIDLDYASWLGQNQIPMTIIFTKCDKRKKKKNGGKRPEENVDDFQDLIRGFFQSVPPWIMTSSVTHQGRDEILLHMAQLRNYWLKH